MERLTELLSDTSPVVLSAIALGITSVGFVIIKTRSGPPNGLIYPPGPPKDPIIGNLRNFPKEKMWGTFNQWQKVYGDMFYLQIPGMNMVVVNSIDVAQELLSKRARNTSGRKVPFMVTNILDWHWNLTFLQPNATFQQMRKMLNRSIGPSRLASHNALIEKTSTKLLLELQGFSGDPAAILVHGVARFIFQITYGEQIWEGHGLEMLARNNEALDMLFKSFQKVWMVDIFPILRFVPSWMPGAGFRRLGIRSTELSTKIRRWPFEQSQALYSAKQLDHSIISDLFDGFGQTQTVMDTVAILYFAGTDNTASSIHHFIHCMFLFPEIAAKVQKEIDDVVGNDRLPQITDRAHLPYTEAVWKESFRWNPVQPIAISHVNTEDEVINGFFIPKGSLINPNIGFMLNDPKVWGDPDNFRPERHLDAKNRVPDIYSLIFGFGTRICPGRDLANCVAFQYAVTIAATYSFLPLEGKSVSDASTLEYTDEQIRWPKDFGCRFVPRSEKAASMLSALAMSSY